MLLRRGCTWLTLMPLLLSLSTGELSFYRDALPETSENIALKHLVRYLEAQRFQQRLHRSHLSSFLSPVHKKYTMQSPRDLLDALTNKVALEKLRQEKLKTGWWTRHQQHQYQDSIVPEQNYPLPYYNVDFKLDYPHVKSSKDDNQGYKDSFGYGYKDDTVGYEQMFDKGMIEKPTLNFHDRYMDRDSTDMLHEGAKGATMHSPAHSPLDGPEFTYKFDNSNLEEKHPFAVKPNDPRYYNDAPFSFDGSDRQDASGVRWKEESLLDEEREPMKHEDDPRDLEQKTMEDSAADASEPEISVARHPLIVPINHDLNSDIYFIAIVAGCSAAAMFALVLISLTWCRLQRGAKAAADIEYPAYGVTGPNKDVSPSGDQRLAQSAQMYHFQHQKQQIIAMENRTSATRDPGSLSEAESDEENEEGDYTVYECPGLASTGEMEVKNPMFHDDPTPATPAQGNNKDEDHI